MLEILEFIFSSVWVFSGCFLMMSFICLVIENICKTIVACCKTDEVKCINVEELKEFKRKAEGGIPFSK